MSKEYMSSMGISNPQYVICRHFDKEHLHAHLWSIIAQIMKEEQSRIETTGTAAKSLFPKSENWNQIIAGVGAGRKAYSLMIAGLAILK